jgi:hypothetical protein
MTGSAARKLKEEQMALQDKAKDPWDDVVLRVEDETTLVSKYVTKLAYKDLNVTMCSEKQIDAVHEAKKQYQTLTLHIDVAGSIVRPSVV